MLGAAYLTTLAPGVTLWDSGEFSAAAASYGIPHPPGTPLYVTMARAWDALLPGVSPAVATNILSALTTALAFAALAALVARWFGGTRWGIAAAICAGAFGSVWRNAVEAEVYGPALLLAAALVYAGDRAGREADAGLRHRWLIVTGYLIVLAVPLHLTSLLAAPAAIWLAITGPRTHPGSRSREALLLAGAFVGTVGLSRVSPALGAVGAALLVTGALPPWRRATAASPWGAAWRTPLLFTAALLVAASALTVIPLRARHDPELNQGNGTSLAAAAAIVTRVQYQAAGLWPRQAPAWLQLGNLFEYADWQIAAALGPGPVPTPARTTVTLVFAVLGGIGARAHARRDRRTFIGVLLLLVCGGPGAVAYLNLKMGPSYGVGFIPAGALHEARERDYFFVLGFTAWGIWAGIGALALRERARGRTVRTALLALPAIPLIANAPAIWRSAPDATIAGDAATVLLESAPSRAVLLARGDNDTYPLWYRQIGEGVRPDVLVVPVALLPSPWFRAELLRRHGLDAGSIWRGPDVALETLRESAARRDRPLAASPVMLLDRLPGAAAEWRWHGLVRVANPPARPGRRAVVGTVSSEVARDIDRRLRRQARAPDAIASLYGGPTRAVIDPAGRQLRKSLLCAGLETRRWRGPAGGGLLAPGCAPR